MAPWGVLIALPAVFGPSVAGPLVADPSVAELPAGLTWSVKLVEPVAGGKLEGRSLSVIFY